MERVIALIKKRYLIHSVEARFNQSNNDEYTYSEPVIISGVRLEPSNGSYTHENGNVVNYTAVLFIDRINSNLAPKNSESVNIYTIDSVTTDSVVKFNGNSYRIDKIDSLFGVSTDVEHLEVYLC